MKREIDVQTFEAKLSLRFPFHGRLSKYKQLHKDTLLEAPFPSHLSHSRALSFTQRPSELLKEQNWQCGYVWIVEWVDITSPLWLLLLRMNSALEKVTKVSGVPTKRTSLCFLSIWWSGKLTVFEFDTIMQSDGILLLVRCERLE